MKSKLFRVLGVVAVVAMLTATMTVAPALAVSTPTLTVGSTTISASTTYTILFTINTNVPAGAAAIVITFPTGSVATAATATIGTTSGIGTAAVPTQAATVVHTSATVLTIDTTTLNGGVGQALGVGTIVQIIVSGEVNPGTTTACGVTVATSSETTAVASNTFTPTAPVVTPPPGVVSGYNAASILLVQSTSINTVIGTTGVTKIIVEPGTYTENVVLGTATMTSLTSITPASTAGATIIAPTTGVAVTISVPGVTFDGFTVTGVAGSDAIVVSALSGTTTIKDCIITSNTNGINVTGAAATVALSLDTFTTTGTGVGVRTAGTGNCTITTGTFTVPATGTAIYCANTGTVTVTGTPAGPVTGLGAAYPAAALTVITGPASTTTTSTGINLASAGTTAINNTVFTGLGCALNISAGTPTVTFTANTVTGCGFVSTTVPMPAIKVAGATAVSITANTITSSKNAVAAVTANGDKVVIMFNDLTGSPAAPMTNTVTPPALATVLNATHNFFGTGVAAPASTAAVSYANPLGVAIVSASGVYAITGTALTNATAGVNISTTAAATLMGSASYATNPVTTAPASTYAVQRYYDAFCNGGGTMTINFYGTTANPVTASSQILFWNATYGRWDVASPQGINLVGNYVFVTLTTTSSPANTDVGGMPFVLVNIPPATPGGSTVVQSPALGAADIAIDATFTWPAVANAVSYEFQIGTDSVFTGSSTVAASTDAYKPADSLEYNTTYWWEVRSVDALGAKSSWTTAFFTTAQEPAAVTTTPVVTPTVIVTQSPPTVIVTQSPATEVQVIPNYLLWAVIAVGAVLVIAVIVLIVRTRRIS